MTKDKDLNNLINECDEILDLFKKDTLNSDRVEECISECVQALLYYADVGDEACTGCIYEPEKGENYPEICGECSNWYPDRYEGIK